MNTDENQFELYHGTIEDIPEGSIITPRLKNGSAFATKNLSGAIAHTKTRLGTGMGQGNKSKNVHHGNIYQVEPLPNDDTLYNDPTSGISKAVTSEKGFRVTRQIASVLKDK